ncbi:MAG: DUF6297 family protein [Gordonia amarae]
MIGVSIPDVRFGWMRRYDVSWIEVVFCGAVIAGFATLVTPARVAGIIELTPWASGHPVAVLSAVLVVTVVAAYRWATVWGPVRVDRATLRWKLSDPAPRAPRLRRATVPVAVAIVCALTCAGAVLGLLWPDVLIYLVPSGAAGGLLAVAAAYRTQARTDRIRYPIRPVTTTDSLHRNTIAPVDGYAGALSLAATMMDTGWIAQARTVRWQFTHHAAPVRALHRNPLCALIQLDLRRLRRHPEAVVRATVAVAVSAVLPSVLTVHVGATVVVALLGMLAARSTALGLRGAAQASGVARMLAVTDRELLLPHVVIPALTAMLYSIVVLLVWNLGIVATVVLWAGVTLAACRHATRPDLPYDAPILIDSLVTGAAFSPHLLATQLRGYGLLAATALVLTMV